MRRLKLKKAAGEYKAGEVLTVIEGGLCFHRDGTVTDANGKQVGGKFIDPQRAESWSDILAKPKKGGKS